MSWRTNFFVMGLRSVGRVIGLNKLIVLVLGSDKYEDKFQSMMLASIRPDDCVWDIGANIGLYTQKFSDLAGVDGNVYAFEPSPVNLIRLKEGVSKKENIVVLPVALGADEAIMNFQQGDDLIGATSKIVTELTESYSEDSVEVELVRGDELVSSGKAILPNVIKIDTEGYELDVLKGLEGILNNEALRTICIEVHFQLLKERDMGEAPSQIEQILEIAGFSYSWPDASHIIANRI